MNRNSHLRFGISFSMVAMIMLMAVMLSSCSVIPGYGTGPKKQTEHFSWIQPNKAHVNLGFNYGAELPDPDALLEGTGKLFRHVKLRSPEDVAEPSLRRLLETATTYRVHAPGTSVVKAAD